MVALSPTSIGFLRRLGVWDSIPAEKSCSFSQMHVWDATSQSRITVDAKDAKDARTDPIATVVENQLVQNSLATVVQDLEHVDVMEGDQVASLETVGETHHLVLKSGKTLSCRLLVHLSCNVDWGGWAAFQSPYLRQH